MNLLKISTGLLVSAIVSLVIGIISYATATGEAWIGPPPASLEVQRVAIADNTFCWVATFVVAAIIARVVARRSSAKSAG